MDKLYRYKGKDYSICVDFPVEIIGRDGVVRHYSFEESIHLYQRRIRSAQVRYEQSEVISAEIDHCSKRIAQLRRSFYARYGWEAFLFSGEIPSALSSEMAGELAAYLRRKFGCGIHIDQAKVTCLQEDSPHFIFMVECSKVANLLIHLFTEESQYNAYNLMLQASSNTHQESEYIIDHIEGQDYWLLICATEPNQRIPSFWSIQDYEETYLREAIQAIHEGNLLEAMAHFMLSIEENPYRRGAYWGTSILAEQMRIHGEAELVLRMAVNYFPQDSGLWLRLAATLLRRNAPETRDALLKAEELQHSQHTHFLWMIYHFMNNEYSMGMKRLRSLKKQSHPSFLISQRWIDNHIQSRRKLIRVACLGTLLSVLLGWYIHPVALLFNIVSLFIFLYAELSWKRQLSRSLKGKSFHQLSLLPSTDIQHVTKAFQGQIN